MANVQVWEAQLVANDFPPVCAMTGAQAETWRKFTFTSTPPWALAFGALGASAFSTRVSGYLPLTLAASKRITRRRWLFGGVVAVAVVLFLAALVVAPSANDSTGNAISGVLLVSAFAVFFLGIIALSLVGRPRPPVARIITRDGQRLIELRNVHSAFIAAVQQHQQARAAQFQAMQPSAPPPPPQSPFPPGKFSY